VAIGQMDDTNRRVEGRELDLARARQLEWRRIDGDVGDRRVGPTRRGNAQIVRERVDGRVR
jgi:hypothetical protein